MSYQRSFSLTEILVAMVLMGLVILAVSSVDITSRRFLGSASTEAWIQDEAKIAMEHIVKSVQKGVGDTTNEILVASNVLDCSTLATLRASLNNDSRGFYILNRTGDATRALVGDPVGAGGTCIWVKMDIDGDGKFNIEGANPDDKVIEYWYDDIGDPDIIEERYQIFYDDDVTDDTYPAEILARGIVKYAVFYIDSNFVNQARVEIAVREDPRPGHEATLDNPETTLISNIVLRAMSTN